MLIAGQFYKTGPSVPAGETSDPDCNTDNLHTQGIKWLRGVRQREKKSTTNLARSSTGQEIAREIGCVWQAFIFKSTRRKKKKKKKAREGEKTARKCE